MPLIRAPKHELIGSWHDLSVYNTVALKESDVLELLSKQRCTRTASECIVHSTLALRTICVSHCVIPSYNSQCSAGLYTPVLFGYLHTSFQDGYSIASQC